MFWRNRRATSGYTDGSDELNFLYEIREARQRWEALQREAISRAGVDSDTFYHKSMPQSELFMTEIIPVIHELYFSYPQNGTVNVLDVGPQTFSGTSLLSRIHATDSFNNLKMKVSAIDIHSKFYFLKELIAPDVNFIEADIFDVKDLTWDLIICSHVIEHVPEPLSFIRRLQELSSRDVIVACPWNENPLTTSGHVNTIDKDFVRAAGARTLKVFTNFSWGKTREVCIFTLDGKAGKKK